MQYLKANTAVTLKIGPFIDETDGKTAETGLTITQAEVRLSKNGGDIAQKNEATSCTHDELGVYGCPIDATDTNTEGRLQLWVHESGALPVFHEYMVLAEAAYDSMFTAKDTGYMDVNIKSTDDIDLSATQKASVQSECNGALVDNNLDHLMKQPVADRDVMAEVVDDTVLANLMTKTDGDTSDFDHATDSLEALADYITEISDLVYEPDASSTIVTGTQVANTYAACAVDNGVYWQIADTGAGDGLDVICEFNLATTRRAVEIAINGYFNGSGGPVEIYAYNYVAGAWNKLSAGTPGTEMRSRPSDQDYVFPLTVGNTDVVTSPGEVKIRFLTASPNAGDNLYLDYVAIVAASTGVVLPEVIANAVWEFDVRDIRREVAGEYPAGHVIKRLVVLGTDVATANTATSFTLTDGTTTNDAYNGMLLEVRDESSATRDIEIRRIVDWTSAKVVTVDRAFSFTPAAGDHVHITCGYLEAIPPKKANFSI